LRGNDVALVISEFLTVTCTLFSSENRGARIPRAREINFAQADFKRDKDLGQ
jgi:hypothetical protein